MAPPSALREGRGVVIGGLLCVGGGRDSAGCEAEWDGVIDGLGCDWSVVIQSLVFEGDEMWEVWRERVE